MNWREGINTPIQARNYNRLMEVQFKEFLASNDSDTLILSAEGMSLLSCSGVERLKRFVMPYFDRVRVIGYVRPPRSYSNSAAQQSIKDSSGMVEDFFENPSLPQYRFCFEKFMDQFGEENVTLRVFARQLLKKGCVVASFLEEIGMPDDLYEQLKIIRSNESISLTAAKVFSVFNKKLPFFKEMRLNTERARKLTNYFINLPGEKFLLPEKVLSKVASAASEDIAWAEEKLNISLGQYDITGSDRDLDDFQSPTLDELFVVAEQLNKLLKENEREKARTKFDRLSKYLRRKVSKIERRWKAAFPSCFMRRVGHLLVNKSRRF